ncbi:MAG: terpene cyclase/mutase family protein [Pirellulales bacterium]|nr:terpene cyclase/mutase family protein [Pirellulales bacterium]
MISKYFSHLWNVGRHFRDAGAAIRQWYREDARYFCISTLLHAVLLLSLGLVQWKAITHFAGEERGRDIASFKPAETDRGLPPDRVEVIFERGQAQLDPSVLNRETLAKMEALPVGVETGQRDLKPEEIGDPEGDPLGKISSLIISGTGGTGDRGSGGVSRPGPGPVPGPGKVGALGLRTKKGRRPWGVTEAEDRAVGAALNWLARHQTLHGPWSLDHRSRCKANACSGAGLFKSDAAATGLAILPFLAAGETHKSKGTYEKHVGQGLAWLIKQQSQTGDLSGAKDPHDPNGKPMYAHAIATLALCEAYCMTKDDPKTFDERLGAAARKAVAYIERSQNESTGGWRYTPGETGDTSVFGWDLMALKSAQLAGIEVNSTVLDRAQIWLNSVAKGENLGLYSYQPYREVTPTMTAVGMLCRQYLGIAPKDPSMLEGKTYLLQNLPDDAIGRNSYYWYYATLTMHNFSDADWDDWYRKMRRILVESQAAEGCATGSWDPERPSADFYGQQGGRLMMTCLNAMTLEIYYRYLPLFQTDSLLPKGPGAIPAAETKKGESEGK